MRHRKDYRFCQWLRRQTLMIKGLYGASHNVGEHYYGLRILDRIVSVTIGQANGAGSQPVIEIDIINDEGEVVTDQWVYKPTGQNGEKNHHAWMLTHTFTCVDDDFENGPGTVFDAAINFVPQSQEDSAQNDTAVPAESAAS